MEKDEADRTEAGNKTGPSASSSGNPASSSANKVIAFGPNQTEISELYMNWVNWKDYETATSDLLESVFTEETLASHTLTGSVGPKPQLDPKKVEDIAFIVTQKFDVFENDVLKVIAKRCKAFHAKYVNRR